MFESHYKILKGGRRRKREGRKRKRERGKETQKVNWEKESRGKCE